MKWRFGIIFFFLFIASLASAQQVATPTFSPDGGTFVESRSFRIQCSTAGAVVHYTSDGTEPTEASPVAYPSWQGWVQTSLILKAKAFKPGMLPSQTKTATFTIVTQTPTFRPDGGLYAELQKVYIDKSWRSAVYYTVNGEDPTPDSPSFPPYSYALIDIDHTCTLKAIAYRPGCEPSAMGTAVFSFREPITRYVTTYGSDSHNGLSWGSAKQTIQAAVNGCIAGDTVWVAKGTYGKSIVLGYGVKLFGGFAGTESSVAERDLKANRTTLQGDNPNYVIQGPTSYYFSPVLVDGFSIESQGTQYGIQCSTSAIISNNRIIDISASHLGCGITVGGGRYSSSVTNNLIMGKRTGIGFGGAEGMIANNTIVANSGTAVNVDHSRATLFNNIIAFNERGIDQWLDCDLTMRHNCVFGNSQYDYVDKIVANLFGSVNSKDPTECEPRRPCNHPDK